MARGKEERGNGAIHDRAMTPSRAIGISARRVAFQRLACGREALDLTTSQALRAPRPQAGL
jgi:hypothetical protein